MAAEGYNWFLILIAVVVSVLVLMGCVYVLVEYQHPEDRNQAWFPKGVVIFGLSLAILSVLMYPMDVANKAACSLNVSPSSCTYAMPMYQLWLAVFVSNLVLVFAFIPFTMFFYEADSDFTFFQKIKSAVGYTCLFLLFIAFIVGILYALVGYVIYPTQELQSGTFPLHAIYNLTDTYNNSVDLVSMANRTCIPPASVTSGQAASTNDGRDCDAFQPTIEIKPWKLRVSLPVYIMAIQSVIGWLVFLVFAGVGVLAAPIDWIHQFLGRPTSVISKSEYMRRARIIAQRAKQLVDTIALLRRQEKNRKWRSNLKRVEREVVTLEEDEFQLERVYPQGEDGEVRWVLFMLGFYVTGFMGVVGVFLSLAWLVHIAVYMLPPYPLSPMLNSLFIVLDNAFSLLGVAAFAGFCLYLMVVAIKGNFLMGLNFVFIKLYPMRSGATMMSAFLVKLPACRTPPCTATMHCTVNQRSVCSGCFSSCSWAHTGLWSMWLGLAQCWACTVHTPGAPACIPGPAHRTTLLAALLQVNTALILTMAPAIIQFCTEAFAVYGSRTDIYDIFGNQVMYLMGISWLYEYSVFLIMFYCVVGLSIVWICFRGRQQWQRKREQV